MITLKTIRERVKGGKVDPLSKMGKSKLTGQEITQYYRDNPDQKKAARDKDVKKAIEIALDMGGAMKVAMREIEKFKRGLTKNPAVKKALQHANESVQETRGYGKKPVSMMTPDEKKKDAERRKAYNAFQKKNRKEEKRDAGKSATGYDIYHDTYSSAMQHAYAHAKKKHGVTVSPDEIDSKVASGPRKPSNGKTVSHILKTDKKQNLHVQVYNTGRKYELNMYVESVVNEEMITYRVKKMQKPELDKFKRSAKMMKLKLNLDQGRDDTVIVVSGTKKNLRDFDSVVRGKSSYGDPSTIRHFDEGLKENAMLNENTIEKMREIVSKKQAMKVGGVMVDMFTASAVVQIYDKVNDANKKKMDKMKPQQLANVAYKIMQKQSVSEEAVSRAQQAAIAISKKERGEKPKNECASEDDFKPHKMYKGDKVVMAKTYADHVKYDKMGYSHEKPVKENRARRDAMRGIAGDDDFRFKKSDDIPTASADDRKAADKNPIIQLRRIADLPKGGEMEFKDGKKTKVSQADAKKALKGFMMMKKGNDKAKFQDNVGRSLKDLKKILRIIK